MQSRREGPVQAHEEGDEVLYLLESTGETNKTLQVNNFMSPIMSTLYVNLNFLQHIFKL